MMVLAWSGATLTMVHHRHSDDVCSLYSPVIWCSECSDLNMRSSHMLLGDGDGWKKTVRSEQHFELHWELSNAFPSNRLSCKCVRIWTHRLCLQADISFEAACRNIYNLTQRKAKTKSGFLQSGDNDVSCHFVNNLVSLPFCLCKQAYA